MLRWDLDSTRNWRRRLPTLILPSRKSRDITVSKTLLVSSLSISRSIMLL
jgi:hypothetical protein